jgi:hypothetical protein
MPEDKVAPLATTDSSAGTSLFPIEGDNSTRWSPSRPRSRVVTPASARFATAYSPSCDRWASQLGSRPSFSMKEADPSDAAC